MPLTSLVFNEMKIAMCFFVSISLFTQFWGLFYWFLYYVLEKKHYKNAMFIVESTAQWFSPSFYELQIKWLKRDCGVNQQNVLWLLVELAILNLRSLTCEGEIAKSSRNKTQPAKQLLQLDSRSSMLYWMWVIVISHCSPTVTGQ